MSPGGTLNIDTGTVGTSSTKGIMLQTRNSAAEQFTFMASSGNSTTMTRSDQPGGLSTCRAAFEHESVSQVPFSQNPELGRVPKALCVQTTDGTVASLSIEIQNSELRGRLNIEWDIWQQR
ncbi:hypothetical protein GCM10029964_088400 [Kibdelosporangium lantanae]